MGREATNSLLYTRRTAHTSRTPRAPTPIGGPLPRLRASAATVERIYDLARYYISTALVDGLDVVYVRLPVSGEGLPRDRVAAR